MVLSFDSVLLAFFCALLSFVAAVAFQPPRSPRNRRNLSVPTARAALFFLLPVAVFLSACEGGGSSSGGGGGKQNTAPVASLSATSYTFGVENVGTAGPAQSFTLSNTGTGALTISGFAKMCIRDRNRAQLLIAHGILWA